MSDATMKTEEDNATIRLIISFKGKKLEIPLIPGTSVGCVKSKLLLTASSDENTTLKKMTTGDMKLLHKGKVLKEDDSSDLYKILMFSPPGKEKSNSKKTIRLMALGVSVESAAAHNKDFQEGLNRAPRIRDDISDRGKMEESRRKRLGNKVLRDASGRNKGDSIGEKKYGFGRIETLPMLPNAPQARDILTELANDPGVIACMTKYKWNVRCLAELYPEGKVGESDVCVMGLNQNKGQKILLRLRTDDLRGFRKILSIRKVLFHELAHNVHSDHGSEFFKLMRQIERECNEMNWTKSSCREMGGDVAMNRPSGEIMICDRPFLGGSGKLGGSKITGKRRDLAAHAAMLRMTEEESEIMNYCGCKGGAKQSDSSNQFNSESATTIQNTEDMNI